MFNGTFTASEVEQEMIDTLAKHFGIEKSAVDREAEFVGTFNADSLDCVELVMQFEDDYNISITDEEALKCCKVGSMIDLVKAKLTEAGRLAS